MNAETLISPEVLVPRLGEQLVKMGLLSAVQLQQALDYQHEGRRMGQPVLLGQAIMDLGLLDRGTLDQAVTEQIIHLRAALEDANHNLEQRVEQRTLELEAALRRLSEINQLKTNIVANVSHELRTPLTHILGYLELLDTQALGDLNDDQKKAVEVALRSAGHLQKQIDDLILFSQVSHGEMTLNLAPVNLSQLVARSAADMQHRAEEAQLSLVCNVSADLPVVRADESKIQWVINQLLDNAVKFTRPGGAVSAAVKREPGNKDMLTFTVQDTGIGIPQEYIRDIFEPFHQLDGSATRRYGGTGLGLSLVLQIVEAHGSLINIHSEPGKGTTISFPLLIAKEI